MNRSGPVVVGVASRGTRLAVRYAAAEAHARQADLRLVTAYPAAAELGRHQPDDVPERHRADAQLLLADMAAEITGEWPGLPIGTELVAGLPASALRTAASGAGLLVVGADTAGPFAEAISGSVPGELVTTAPCPVVVTPRQEWTARETGPVVIAYDEPDTSRAALAYAFAAAARSSRGLTVLHCAPPDAGATDRGDLALTGFGELYPEVLVTVEVSRTPAREALATASRTAAVLVLGSRGRGPLASGLFGSVTRDLIRRSACPVVVARATNVNPPHSPPEERT